MYYVLYRIQRPHCRQSKRKLVNVSKEANHLRMINIKIRNLKLMMTKPLMLLSPKKKNKNKVKSQNKTKLDRQRRKATSSQLLLFVL